MSKIIDLHERRKQKKITSIQDAVERIKLAAKDINNFMRITKKKPKKPLGDKI